MRERFDRGALSGSTLDIDRGAQSNGAPWGEAFRQGCTDSHAVVARELVEGQTLSRQEASGAGGGADAIVKAVEG